MCVQWAGWQIGVGRGHVEGLLTQRTGLLWACARAGKGGRVAGGGRGRAMCMSATPSVPASHQVPNACNVVIPSRRHARLPRPFRPRFKPRTCHTSSSPAAPPASVAPTGPRSSQHCRPLLSPATCHLGCMPRSTPACRALEAWTCTCQSPGPTLLRCYLRSMWQHLLHWG